jgi:hypothetical protein
MNARLPLLLQLAGGVASSLIGLAAAAEGREVGQIIVYEMTRTSTTKTDLSSLPSTVRGQAEANQKLANGKAFRTKLTLASDQVDADGNAHVNVSFTESMEGLSAMTAAAMSAAKSFQGTLTADGRLLPAYDPNVAATLDAHGRYSASATENVNAQQMQLAFANFNTFITGLLKHGRPNPGDTWRVVVQDPYGVSRNYDFAVAADAAAPRGSPVVTMTANSEVPHNSLKSTATGHYDAARHLLVDFHEDSNFATQSPNGISSAGTTSIDIKLHP